MTAVGKRLTSSTWQRRAAMLAAFTGSCTSNNPADPCPDEPPPAFTITVTAVEGPLPLDTHITMAYGGGSEEYALGGPDNSPKVMFCIPDLGSAGAGGMGGAGAPATSTADLLTCELWIEGAATVWVSGGDYEELEVELRGEANECGPETVEEELVLGKQETDPGQDD